jgi:two-component system chemotaxis sensor kinase CheA
MLPLSVILERFPRMVEETATSLGKDVYLSISGDSVRVDSTVLAKLSDPLLHLVRNAVDHGIETPEQRKKAGKSGKAVIRIDCRTEGSRISVEVSDNGAGLDYAAIKAKAMALWPENEADIREMGAEDLAPFLFRPGFTTKSTSSTISGRGVGLDIVKVNVESARGQVHLRSKPGEGSTFTLLLPVSASTMDGMFVLCSGQKYFIPASAISRTMLVDALSVFRIRDKEMFNLEGVNIPLVELSAGLELDQTGRKSENLPVLLVRGPAETIGVVVDRILGYDSLVYQSLPQGLRRNPLVQGVVFNTSFSIIPILNMWAVLEKLRSVRIMDTHKRFTKEDKQEQISILVVDDSVSTREIEISMLELEGYAVTGAVDGVDALLKIRSSRFDLVVSDLNMPRMDGLKLLENIRSDETLASMPVIFVTTVDEGESRKKAEDLGVNKYILKSTFKQDNLISAIRELVSGPGASR